MTPCVYGAADHQLGHLRQVEQLDQVAADFVVAVELINFVQQSECTLQALKLALEKAGSSMESASGSGIKVRSC